MYTTAFARDAELTLTPLAAEPGRSVTTDWRTALPTLSARGVSLRELRLTDAPALYKFLTTEEVARFLSPPPTTLDGFERFITWTISQRAAGRGVCFGVVPDGCDTAIGIFQIRQVTPDFETAEWGFALDSPYWGTGVFAIAAELAIRFAFQSIGAHRLEARASVDNGRGNGALAKVGAVKEGVLRRSFLRGGQRYDQALWSIVREEWLQAKVVWGSPLH